MHAMSSGNFLTNGARRKQVENILPVLLPVKCVATSALSCVHTSMWVWLNKTLKNNGKKFRLVGRQMRNRALKGVIRSFHSPFQCLWICFFTLIYERDSGNITNICTLNVCQIILFEIEELCSGAATTN